MPIISLNERFPTALSLFSTDTLGEQDSLLGVMSQMVRDDSHPGVVSSVIYSGLENPGVASFLQWRSSDELEAWYASEEFKQRVLPTFSAMSASMRILQTEVALAQRSPRPGATIQASAGHDDYTVVTIYGVAQADQDDLLETLGESGSWKLQTPGCRAAIVLRGLRAQGIDGAFAVEYSQWDNEESFHEFRLVPDEMQPEARRKTHQRMVSLATYRDWNSYHVAHTWSAAPE